MKGKMAIYAIILSILLLLLIVLFLFVGKRLLVNLFIKGV